MLIAGRGSFQCEEGSSSFLKKRTKKLLKLTFGISGRRPQSGSAAAARNR
jgi:hypothetical protein